MIIQKIITIELGKRSKKTCISGLRIRVYDIFGWLTSGMTIEVILEDFPELIHLSDEEMQKSLKEFYELLIYRYLIERHHLANTVLIKFLITTTGNLISYNKIYNDLKSQGFNIGRQTVYEYIEHLEDSYTIYTTSLFTENLREQNRNPRKLYCIDNGLKNLLSIKPNTGRGLENIIFIQLRRKYAEIFYFKGTQEIDFCYLDNKQQINLTDVAIQLEENQHMNVKFQV